MISVLVLGSGGHAAVVISTLIATGADIAGALDPDATRHGSSVLGIKVLGDDAVLDRQDPADVLLANGVGDLEIRRALFDGMTARGFSFCSAIHPAATVAEECGIGDGAQIMAGAVLQPRTSVGRNAVINTRASVDHDCTIGDHAFIAPGAVLTGGVVMGAMSIVGAGAVVVPGVEIGARAIVAAGATVTSDVAANARVGGTPARVL